MVAGNAARTTFTAAEADEIRGLLDELPHARLAVQRMSKACMRRMGLEIAANPTMLPTRAQFEDLVASKALRISEDKGAARAVIRPHPSGHVFRVAIGVTGHSIPSTWNAFEQRYQWFGKQPRSVASGAHLFALGVDRWKSAVVGLYEAVSSGAEKLPGSSDPNRWPWALGVRPLAALPPPLAERVEGQQGPQSGLPAHVADADARTRLYRAVAESPPPPGPQTPEQRVQELERQDVVADVLEAVRSLGRGAREQAVVSRAIELGGWSTEELEARAWYTGSGVGSHIEHIVRQALRFEVGSKGNLRQVHGVYSLTNVAPAAGFGVPYRLTGDGVSPGDKELPAQLVDLSELDRATKRHMDLQDCLADALRKRKITPLSPGSWQPQFDLAFEQEGKRYVAEVKSGDPVSAQQVRLGVGQLLEYRHLLGDADSQDVCAVLLVESAPPIPWAVLAGSAGIQILRADQIEKSLTALFSGGH